MYEALLQMGPHWGPGGGMWGTSGGGGAFALFWNAVALVAILAILVGGVYLLFRWTQSGAGGVDLARTDRAMETLREQYARGEISTEEFEDRRARLTESAT